MIAQLLSYFIIVGCSPSSLPSAICARILLYVFPNFSVSLNYMEDKTREETKNMKWNENIVTFIWAFANRLGKSASYWRGCFLLRSTLIIRGTKFPSLPSLKFMLHRFAYEYVLDKSLLFALESTVLTVSSASASEIMKRHSIYNPTAKVIQLNHYLSTYFNG